MNVRLLKPRAYRIEATIGRGGQRGHRVSAFRIRPKAGRQVHQGEAAGA